MNQDTGAIQQIVSVRESGFEGAEIRLVIEVHQLYNLSFRESPKHKSNPSPAKALFSYV